MTLALPAATLLLARLPLMGVDLTLLEGGPGFDPTIFGLFAFGPGPIVSAALLVEVLALVLPRWRRWRHDGYPGRSRLWTRVRVATVVLAAIQSFFLLRWMMHLPPDMKVLSGGVLAHGLAFTVPVLGPLLLLWLGEQIDRYGTGRGLSVLIAAFSLPELLKVVPDVVDSFERVELGAQHSLVALALVVAGAISVAWRPTAGWREQHPRPQLLAPASGIAPLGASRVLLGLPLTLRSFLPFEDRLDLFTRGTYLNLALDAALVIVLAAAFTRLFNRPARVTTLWQRGPGVQDSTTARQAVASAWWPGYGRALALMLALTLAQWLIFQARLGANVLTLIILGCVVLDVAGELRFRRAQGAVTAVWPVHRTYAVGCALARLEQAGIPAYPRCLRHGALLSFFGPHVPVELLVPEARAEEAQALLRALLAPEPPPIESGLAQGLPA